TPTRSLTKAGESSVFARPPVEQRQGAGPQSGAERSAGIALGAPHSLTFLLPHFPDACMGGKTGSGAVGFLVLEQLRPKEAPGSPGKRVSRRRGLRCRRFAAHCRSSSGRRRRRTANMVAPIITRQSAPFRARRSRHRGVPGARSPGGTTV